ncbi:flavodoxin domain-containing protein [Candidatus Gottesmanbacteria bacterium]|nr:flavodoxin domain-containing protein [Candidatus Gottesmanbacteria bacterium]
MDIVLVYATNSGGTAQAAKTIADALTSKGHTVRIKDAKDAGPDDLTGASPLILGSPSWDYNGMEGQPLPEMVELIARCKDSHLEGKPCAVFGLGDSSYTYYCGAVTYLETFVKRNKGMLIVPSLKIDGYYMHSDASQHITVWANEVADKLSSRTV